MRIARNNDRWIEESQVQTAVRDLCSEGYSEGLIPFSRDIGLKTFLANTFRLSEFPIICGLVKTLNEGQIRDLPIGTSVSDLFWRELKILIEAKKSLIAADRPPMVGAPEKMRKTTITFSGPAAGEDRNPLTLRIPREVSGGGALYAVLPIEEELIKFFQTLPVVRQKQPASEHKRGQKKNLKELVSYRGWTISELLKLNLGDFGIQFRNHPRFRTIAHATDYFGIGALPLSQPLEMLSYQHAYTVLVVKELRKLREESKVFLPRELTLYTDAKSADMFKEALLSFLRFYRTRTFVY